MNSNTYRFNRQIVSAIASILACWVLVPATAFASGGCTCFADLDADGKISPGEPSGRWFYTGAFNPWSEDVLNSLSCSNDGSCKGECQLDTLMKGKPFSQKEYCKCVPLEKQPEPAPDPDPVTPVEPPPSAAGPTIA